MSPAPLLTFPLRAERQLYRYLPLRKAGARLLAAAERIVRLRAIAKTAGSREALQSEFGRSLPALMYHHVGPLHSGIYRYLTVTPEQFERQIRWLAHNGYVGIRPSDWLLWRREGRGLPDKPVLITFDDAYQETAEYALPILQRYGFCAVVYVVTGQLGGTNEWDAANGCATFLLMTAEQIRYWDARGFEFGAHTRTHPDLTKLSALECLAEVQGSKNDLSAVLGKPVVSFAYPYGKCNKAAQDLVRSEFDLACGIEEGINYLRGDPHLLRRAYVGPEDSLIEFALSVRLGGLKSFRKWRERFRLRSRLRKVVKRMFPFWG